MTPAPAALVRTEAAALEALATRLEGPMAAAFDRAVELILRCGEERGRVVVTGMGKSGIIAQKIAATLSSTGSPALFLHPAEAVHGDLGVLMTGDVVVAAVGERRDGGDFAACLATLKRQRRLSDQLLLPDEFDSGDGKRCGSGLRSGARGLRAEPCADGLDYFDAGAGRRAGGCGEPAQGIPR